ncbi:hypothetical protein HY469_03895 [Candidatus Roizmanbacteria bacterium]|nr:hypothetical protein [Candidatus Roizmanbacteria bacterium]
MDQPIINQPVSSPVPPMTPPAQPAASPAAPTALPKHSSKKVPMIIGLVFFFVLVIMASFFSLVTYASMDMPGLSNDQEDQIKLMMFAVPLTPKTPEQILIAAAQSNSRLTTYNPDLSFSGNIGSTDVTLGSLDLKVSGPIDVTSLEDSSFDLTVEAGVNYGGTLYSASGQMRKKGDMMYGKIDDISDSIINTYMSYTGNDSPEGIAEIQQQLAAVFMNWALYDLSGLESEARSMLEEQEKEQASTIEEAQEMIQNLLLDDEVLPEVTRMDDEDIADVSSYHLQLKPSPETLKSLILSWYEEQGETDEYLRESLEESIGAIEVFTIDVWFGKRDMILRKVGVASRISIAALLQSSYGESAGEAYGTPFSDMEDLVDPKINTSAVLVLRDVGAPVDVQIPSPTVDAIEYSEMLQDAFLTEEQRQIKAQQRIYEEELTTMSSELIKYYVQNDVYPPSLSSVSLGDIDTSPYTYRRSSDGTDYILYVELESIDSSFYFESTPYYGLTGSFNYPRQLSQYDFDNLE